MQGSDRLLTANHACRVLLTAVALLCVSTVRAHEIPGRTDVEMWVHDLHPGVQIAVRVPLGALQDLELPLVEDRWLDTPRADAALADAATLWIVDFLDVRAGDTALPAPQVLGVRASLPSDRSFASFRGAVDHILGPALPAAERLHWSQAHLDVLLDYSVPRALRGEELSVDPRFDHLGLETNIDLRILTFRGDIRGMRLEGAPGPVPLDPGLLRAAGTFVASGVEHILSGFDHLLFLVCLVLPLLAWRPLLAIVTAFTAGHSVTLVAASLGFAPTGAWFSALTEAAIAASIVWMALENIVTATRVPSGASTREGLGHVRWRIAFTFGLIHGFGFASVLAEELQFSGEHLVAALLSFNLGVEIGQVVFLVAFVPALALVLRSAPRRATTIVVAALVLHTAWHWMLERAERFLAYPLSAPTADLVLLRSLMQIALLALIAWALYRVLARLFDALLSAEPAPPDAREMDAGL